jgi:hypothetical protein
MRYRVEFFCEFSHKWMTYAVCITEASAKVRANMFEAHYAVETRITVC